MSNSLAIATVSLALRNLLLAKVPAIDPGLDELEVTLQPPDLARKNVTKAQLNVFMYGVGQNPAWRNADPPHGARPGEHAPPALPLDLHYLLTAYGRGESDNDGTGHRVLAAAMSVLHDHPLLGSDLLRDALEDNDLADQVERVRITPLPLGIDDMSRLWTSFQSNYRISVAYECAVILIDSRSASRAPLPVLRRGPDDRGVIARASAAATLESIKPPDAQAAARLGDEIVLNGRNLGTVDTVARLSSLRLESPIELPLLPGPAAGTLRLRLPDTTSDPAADSTWAPGLYTLALRHQAPGRPAVLSNELPLGLAPRIGIQPLAHSAGDVALQVTCAPRLREGQRVLLLFGDRAVPPAGIVHPADPQAPTSLDFLVPGVAPGTWVVRLRVDGVDSIPVDFSGTVPVFAADQQVVVS